LSESFKAIALLLSGTRST